MNPYNLSVLFFSFCTFFISILIWLKRGDRIGWFYFIFSSVVTIWGIAWSILISNNVEYSMALFCAKLAHSAAALIAVIWWHFALIYTGRDQETKFARFLLAFYFLALLICLSAFTPWFVAGVGPAVGFRYYTKPAFVFHIFMVLYWTGVTLGFYEFLREIKRLKSNEKFHLKVFFVATFSGFVGGSLVQAPIYNISMPQYNLFLMPIYPFIMAFILIRSRLFDIEEIAQAFQREKLATVGLIAASVNHEIKNPLYAIKGLMETFIENKKEGITTKSPEEISERVLNNVNRALEVMAQLNRFARPSDENISKEGTSISKTIKTVLDLVSREFELEQIKIHNLLTDHLPKVAISDRQLEEIFFNLIVNACHAMPKGGTLTISGNAQNDKVAISVADTGTGISSAQLKHLFEPFRTTKGDGGTGLGLYITKQIIERNHGKISVHSEEGKGTSFILEFKRA